MLSGTASVEALGAGAPLMPTMDVEPVRFEGAEVLQAAFEIPYASRQALLPPGLHPTSPPLMIVLAWKVPEGPWGPFTMAQVRVSCRSGVRPRGFVVGCQTSSPESAAGLAAWGMRAGVRPVRLDRFYDSVVVDAGPALRMTGMNPDPLGAGDVQYTVTTTLAQTPKGLRLVQVEPEYAMERAERLTPRIDHFDSPAWGSEHLVPRYPVVASIAVGTIEIPRLRFVSRPDVMAFEGTEPL